MSRKPDLAKLENVELKQAWDNEPRSFTPWLAENLDILAEEIGIKLELEAREFDVGGFKVDILARNRMDDSRVLIENQLGQADHGHLGQLLTYLAGLGANVVIWVASEFRDGHLSAITWLNEHTVDPFAFFAVRVSVVRIANSPLAPVFEVLARPNEWDRQVHTMAREKGQLTDLRNL